jgi:hypothetical protein
MITELETGQGPARAVRTIEKRSILIRCRRMAIVATYYALLIKLLK